MHETCKTDDHIPLNSIISTPIKVERKVREIAGSLYVCLPKYWADNVRLNKGQNVIIELTGDHSCRIEIRGD